MVKLPSNVTDKIKRNQTGVSYNEKKHSTNHWTNSKHKYISK